MSQSKVYSPNEIAKQAEMLGNRVKKNYRHLAPKFNREAIEAFRLYDRDIPEIRAVVDWYKGYAVLGEYVREQTDSPDWIESMARSLAIALDIPLEHIKLRRRTTRPKSGERYQRLAKSNEKMAVREGDLNFLVNLDDYLDTGLFLDHRLTRSMIQKLAENKSFLNLFAYTGSFTVYAAKGGARSTTTVDLSPLYIDWAKENLTINHLADGSHEWISEECRAFLQNSKAKKRKWELIFLDPPSFSTREGMDDFDIQFHHAELIEDCLAVLEKSGLLFFSTNHQRFIPELDTIPGIGFEEISAKTLPIDFKGRTPHRLFKIWQLNS